MSSPYSIFLRKKLGRRRNAPLTKTKCFLISIVLYAIYIKKSTIFLKNQ